MNFIEINKPILALAPMDGYTDCAFREIVKKYSNPDLLFTEFVNCHGLFKAFDKLANTLRYNEKQRPIIAQLFGKEPEYFYKSALILCLLGFDGIDINIGCPAKNVAQKGGGAALIKKPLLAVEIIRSVKKAIKDYSKGKYDLDPKIYKAIKIKVKEWNVKLKSQRYITLSVKTRLGYSEYQPDWFKCLEDEKLDFITVHARTYKQKFTGKANWKAIENIASSIDTPVIGNGDIKSVKDLSRMVKQTNCAGVMIGRGAIGRPWVFDEDRNYDGNVRIIKKIVMDHTNKYLLFCKNKKFYELRKHFAQYFRGFKGAKKLREKVVRTNSLKELERIISFYKL